MKKAIIKKEHKEKLLGSQALMGIVGDELGIQVQTVQRQLQQDAPTLTEVLAMDAIRKALDLPFDAIVHEYTQVGDKELHHE